MKKDYFKGKIFNIKCENCEATFNANITDQHSSFITVICPVCYHKQTINLLEVKNES